MENYFAYGSNISMKQMKQRCSSAQFHAKAILQGYRLFFPLQSGRWGGGVAGIIPESEKKVEGVLYKISKDDLKKLDKFEGVDKGHYTRQRRRVVLPDGANIEAWVYFANPEKGGPFPPSKKYLETIIEGAKKHHLSEGFIEDLKNLKEKITSNDHAP